MIIVRNNIPLGINCVPLGLITCLKESKFFVYSYDRNLINVVKIYNKLFFFLKKKTKFYTEHSYANQIIVMFFFLYKSIVWSFDLIFFFVF